MKNYSLSLFFCSITLFFSCNTNSQKNYTLFVGTFNERGNEGIYSYLFDATTGELSQKQLAAKLTGPNFLKISINKKYLYAVNQTNKFECTNGSVVSFSVNKNQLLPINEMPAHASSCHIGISADGNYVASSSYGGGNVSIFKIDENGGLHPNPQFINHKILDTVKKAKAHSSLFTKDGLFIADLGLDAIKRYTQVDGIFVPAQQASINFPDGAGPRHFTFGKNKKILYVINELNATITVFRKNTDGDYIELETKNTLAPDYTGQKSCADIHLSDDGKFLYGSNRGENTIVIFKVDASTGKLTLVGRENVHGDWPRNFALDPTNNFLLVANKKSDNITIFKRDVEKGTLSFLQEVKLPAPVCLEFLDL